MQRELFKIEEIRPTFFVICHGSFTFFFSCGTSNRFRTRASPYEVSRSHSLDTARSLGLFWTSDRPNAETSTWQHTTLDKRQTPMSLVGFEPTIPASKRPQTHALYYAVRRSSIHLLLLQRVHQTSRPEDSWCYDCEVRIVRLAP